MAQSNWVSVTYAILILPKVGMRRFDYPRKYAVKWAFFGRKKAIFGYKLSEFCPTFRKETKKINH